MKQIIAVSIISACFAGCMTAPMRLNTPSGKPEVFILNATKKKVSDAIVNRELSKGWDLKSQSDSLLVFATKNTGFGAQLLFGSRYDTVPENRITFTMVEINEGVRLLIKTEVVTNPGSAFEQTTDLTLNPDMASREQTALEEIKADFPQSVSVNALPKDEDKTKNLPGYEAQK